MKARIQPVDALHQVKVAHHLHHPVLAPGKGLRQAAEFGCAGYRGWRVKRLGGAVVVRASGGKAGRTGVERGTQQFAHGGNSAGGGGLSRLGARAHHAHAQRVVGHHGQVIQAVRHGVQRVHVLAKAVPGKAHAIFQRRAGNVFYPLHQPDQPVFAARLQWRKADAAIAHHHRGHTVVDAEHLEVL